MEQENVAPEVGLEAKKSTLFQVTPLSKYLAMILFVLMPFIGGWIGYHYAPEKVIEVERVVVEKLQKNIENKSSLDVVVFEFKAVLEESVVAEIGQPIEGFSPQMFMQVFPGLQESDFSNVEALIGHYEFRENTLVHEIGDVDMIHSAAFAIAPEGYQTLFENLEGRIEILDSDNKLNEITSQIEKEKDDKPRVKTIEVDGKEIKVWGDPPSAFD
jgi:hypothetical protein